MAGVAADIVGADFDPAFADRRGPQQIDREPPEMRKPVRRRRAFDGAADQRRGRAGVLMLGVPRANGERARAIEALAQFNVSSVQGEPPRVRVPSPALLAKVARSAGWGSFQQARRKGLGRPPRGSASGRGLT